MGTNQPPRDPRSPRFWAIPETCPPLRLSFTRGPQRPPTGALRGVYTLPHLEACSLGSPGPISSPGSESNPWLRPASPRGPGPCVTPAISPLAASHRPRKETPDPTRCDPPNRTPTIAPSHHPPASQASRCCHSRPSPAPRPLYVLSALPGRFLPRSHDVCVT